LYWPVVVFFTIIHTFFNLVIVINRARYTPKLRKPTFTLDKAFDKKSWRNKGKLEEVNLCTFSAPLLLRSYLLCIAAGVYASEWVKCDGDMTNSGV